MRQCWLKKAIRVAENTQFNRVELELTWTDILDLEFSVTNQQLPSTQGFFFGEDSDEEYYDRDLQFIEEAKAELFLGNKVWYHSSW